MSRRRGEFEHRTSIFEGAFRAWSHLGGLDPIDLETKAASDLDPLLFPIEDDPRIALQRDRKKGSASDLTDGGEDLNAMADDSSANFNLDDTREQRREYPYEPLPRLGLAHPFVQAILSPWLGPDADQDAIQLGLTTLRTWWQHRRKGESGSAIVALGTEKMTGVVEGYTRHFFNIAHCLVVMNKEQPPRTLQGKMRELEKVRAKKSRKRSREEEELIKATALAYRAGIGRASIGDASGNFIASMPGTPAPALSFENHIPSVQDDAGMTNIERLHAAQRRQLAAEGGVLSLTHRSSMEQKTTPEIDVKGNCLPGTVDLPSLIQQVSVNASQLAHRGRFPLDAHSNQVFGAVPSHQQNCDPSLYGDPNLTPVILNSEYGDIQILMTIQGMTCSHCVKIVETVLKGCRGTRSPIDGLLDACVDLDIHSALLKIEKASEARRIAYEAARNLTLVGYVANAKSINIQNLGSGKCGNGEGSAEDRITLHSISAVFDIVPRLIPILGKTFDWTVMCCCPDNDVLKMNCRKHLQMNRNLLDAFDTAEHQVYKIVSGCSGKYDMTCTAGIHCFCKSRRMGTQQDGQYVSKIIDIGHLSQKKEYSQYPIEHSIQHNGVEEGNRDAGMKNRTPSNSLGGLALPGRHSITSNTTFGRAMSGLSALSIDWDNMDDFDITIDHSAGINNDIVNSQRQLPTNIQIDQQEKVEDLDNSETNVLSMKADSMSKRSSLIKNIQMNSNMNVSFNV